MGKFRDKNLYFSQKYSHEYFQCIIIITKSQSSVETNHTFAYSAKSPKHLSTRYGGQCLTSPTPSLFIPGDPKKRLVG